MSKIVGRKKMERERGKKALYRKADYSGGGGGPFTNVSPMVVLGISDLDRQVSMRKSEERERE